MAYSLGVDLGTTFVAAALAVDDRVEMFTLGDRSEVTPSAVFLREDGTLVTGEAAASLRTVNSPDRVAREFKRRLGDPTPVVLGGRPFTATELLAALLRDVLDKVVDSEGGPPSNVVLSHPANWGPFRRALFEEVVRLGGLASAVTVTEPEAAATRYAASRKLGEGKLVAVYDLGGGTFDATVLRTTAAGMEIVGTPEGVERLGGIDFDEAILRYVDYTSESALTDLDLRDPPTVAALARLRQDCILAKETLSADTETVLPVFLPNRHFEVTLTRPMFEDLIRAQVESTIGALARTLDSARVSPAELDAVLLIGGSSRIPLVTEMVSAQIGRPIAVDTHPKYAVALGAATLAGRAPAVPGGTLAGERPGCANTTGTAGLAAVGTAGLPVPVGTGWSASGSDAPTYLPPAPPPPYQSPNRSPLPPAPPQPSPPQPGPPPAQPSAELPTAAQRGTSWREQSTAIPPPAPSTSGPPTPPHSASPPTQHPPASGAQPTQYVPAPPDKYGSWPQAQQGQRQSQQGQPPGGGQPEQPAYAGYQNPYQQRPDHWGQPPQSPRPGGAVKQRILLATIVVALLVAAGATAWVLLSPAGTPTAAPGTSAPPAASTPRLVLTTDQVRFGDSYYLTATGFTPGEDVRLSWTGPTSGIMDAVPADANGVRNHGPVIERDPPGQYVIIATGMSSGRTAEARLQVLAADEGN
ncbi:MAG: Hsp70 family protein [Pseudonocardia sp.]